MDCICICHAAAIPAACSRGPVASRREWPFSWKAENSDKSRHANGDFPTSLVVERGAHTRRGHVLTDLQGQPLSAGLPGGTGEFTIGVRGVIAANSWAPGPLKSTTVFTTNYLSG
jgi:hypothetical protein